MNDPVLNFASFFRAKIAAVPELASVVGSRIYNSKAPQGAVLPFAVFTIIPLENNYGQARSPIQTRLLCDFKIETRLPVSSALGTAVEKSVEKFRTARSAHSYGNFRISVWGLSPISQMSSGAVSEEDIYSLGQTFQATMSRIDLPLALVLFPFIMRSNASANFPLSSSGSIPFTNRPGNENNIALVSGKIPFINRSGAAAPINPA